MKFSLVVGTLMASATVTLDTLYDRKIGYINGVDMCSDHTDLGPANGNQACEVGLQRCCATLAISGDTADSAQLCSAEQIYDL